MDALIIMLRNVLVFVALAVPGYLLVKSGQLKHEQSGVLSKIMIYVGMPFLIFSSTVDKITLSRELIFTILAITLLGIVYTLVMFLASAPLTAMEREEKTRGMMRFCSVFSNNGFLGIPLAIAVFGADSPILTVVIIINIISNVLMQTFGICLVSGDRRQMNIKKALLNPLLIAFVIGIILNLLNIKVYVPEISTFSVHFANIVTPISMTILGMKMASVRLPSLFASAKTYYVSALRLVVFPAAIVALLIGLKALGATIVTNDFILGAFISFAMPTAGLASTFADSFDGDTKSAVAFTLGTTVVSVITIPILYFIICACL